MAAEIANVGFTMHGAREALDAGAAHIEEQIIAIEQAVGTNPGLTFDLAKTLLESTCKTILAERKADYNGAWDLPKLLRETTRLMRLVPAELAATADVSESLRKTTGGLQTVIQGICELRNSHGFASHGKDPNFRQLDVAQALLIARASDAIVSFLLRMHSDEGAAAHHRGLTEEERSRRDAFDEYVDEANGLVRIFDLEYRASEVLLQVDPRAYEDHLAVFEPNDEDAHV
jgi:hypothetical protein